MARPKKESPDRRTISNDERLAAMRQVTAAKRTVDEAQGVYRALLKRLQGEGLDTKAIIATNAASRQDPAIVQAHEAERLRLMGLRSIISIDELLAEADHLQVSARAKVEDDLGAVQDAGYRAGKNGVPVGDCPHPVASEYGVAWAKWHANGVAAAVHELGGDGAIASTARERPQRGDDLPLAGGTARKPAKKAAGRPKGATGKPRGRAASAAAPPLN